MLLDQSERVEVKGLQVIRSKNLVIKIIIHSSRTISLATRERWMYGHV